MISPVLDDHPQDLHAYGAYCRIGVHVKELVRTCDVRVD